MCKPDGKITANLVGQIVVAGMTMAKLEELLVEKTSDQLCRPEVVVGITKFAERNVYIGGEVGKPGMFRYRQGLTTSNACRIETIWLINRPAGELTKNGA